MTIRILHCVPDEKFIDSMIVATQTQWKDCYQEYAVISNKEKGTYRYIHRQEDVKNVNKKQFLWHIRENHINVVIIHSLGAVPAYLIPKIGKEIIVVWLAWGYDIYTPYRCHYPLIRKSLFHDKTQKIIKKDILKRLKRLFAFLLYCGQQSHVEKAISRITFFSGVIPEEYDMIANEHYKYFWAKPIIFNYTSVNSPYTKENIMLPPVFVGDDIQIGNSADPTNNHIDVFHLLSKYSLGQKRIIVPMSYGGTRYYRNAIMKDGKKLWGDKFIPLNSFMPLKEYNKIMMSSMYAIFYHERQQAMGNIISALWRGCMVFLSKTSPIYAHLKQRGYIVYTVQDDLYRIGTDKKMSMSNIIQNRKQIVKFYSVEAEERKAIQIMETFKKKLQSKYL